MKRGRKSKLLFGLNHPHIGEEATKATNTGAYTVESLEGGIYYFCEGNYIETRYDGTEEHFNPLFTGRREDEQ